MTLDELIDFYTPEISEAFRLAIADVVDNVILSEVTKAIELGDAVAAFKALGFSEAAMRPITKKLEQAFEDGGVEKGRTFPKTIYTKAGPTVYRFDVRNSRAEKWVRSHSARVVTKITDQTKLIIRNKMYDGLKAGDNPRKISLELVGRYDRKLKKRVGGVIGLNEPQERYVASMREELKNFDRNYFTREKRDFSFDKLVEKMFNEGDVSDDQVESLVTRYSDNLLKLRGDTIARDAAMEALNASEHEALKQAVDLGAVKSVTRKWDSAGDDGRTRETHLDMDDKEVGLDEPWTFPNGVKVMYPQDRSMPNDVKNLAKETINCRCKSRTVVDWLKELD